MRRLIQRAVNVLSRKFVSLEGHFPPPLRGGAIWGSPVPGAAPPATCRRPSGANGVNLSGTEGVDFSGTNGAKFSGAKGTNFSGAKGVSFSGAKGVGFSGAKGASFSRAEAVNFLQESLTQDTNAWV